MSEFIFDDGRKAEKVESSVDPMTKVTEVYVEPRFQKKLAKRITERLCVCEREIETIDESTGEVVDRVVERVCEGGAQARGFSSVFTAAERKISEKKKAVNVALVAFVVLQAAVLAYVMFVM